MIFTIFSSPSSYSSRDLRGHTDRIEEIKDICPRGTFFCQFNTISLCAKVKYPSSRRVKGYKNKAQVKFVVLLCLIHRYTHTHTHIPVHMGKYVFASFICQHVHFLHFVF